MRRRFRGVLLTSGFGGAVGLAFILGGAVLDGGPPATAALSAENCSKASLSGSYGETFEGISKALGQIAAVGLWRFDGNGTFKAIDPATVTTSYLPAAPINWCAAQGSSL